jgi:hypothetical protein
MLLLPELYPRNIVQQANLSRVGLLPYGLPVASFTLLLGR